MAVGGRAKSIEGCVKYRRKAEAENINMKKKMLSLEADLGRMAAPAKPLRNDLKYLVFNLAGDRREALWLRKNNAAAKINRNAH